jgi:hypothetical protein
MLALLLKSCYNIFVSNKKQSVKNMQRLNKKAKCAATQQLVQQFLQRNKITVLKSTSTSTKYARSGHLGRTSAARTVKV